MKLKCLIVDDEPGARRILEEFIAETDFLELLGQAENPLKAKALLSDQKIDLLFLDINMPKMSGLEFLKNNPSRPLTILTTAYSEYALEGFELDVLDYLLKPFSPERFQKACLKAREYHALLQNSAVAEAPVAASDHFFVKCSGKIEKVFYDKLLYIEAMQNYVILHTEQKKMIVYHTIKGIEAQLPAEKFLKVHKSTIVNRSRIDGIQGNELFLGPVKVTISQNLKSSVMQEILKDKILRR